MVGLRTATGGGVEGLGESSVRALAKLEQVLPGRLRRRVGALHAYTVPLLRAPGGPGVEPGVLTELAAVCRDGERLRFAYRDHAGAGSRRTVEPHRLVCTEHRWYLVAWDLDREDWRTFRADRITPGRRTDRASPRARARRRIWRRTSPKGCPRGSTPTGWCCACWCRWRRRHGGSPRRTAR